MKSRILPPFIFSIVFLSSNGFGLTSPFASTVDGITIPNTHIIDREGKILRGMAPNKSIQELIDFGVTDVLIFKNPVNNEIKQEVSELKSFGLNYPNVRQIPFEWKDIKDYGKACRQSVAALQFIKEVAQSSDRKIFFHCTVGEDRTGFLAGLWQSLTKTNNMSYQSIWNDQVCENGFGRGNPKKPMSVVTKLQQDLVPIYWSMIQMIQEGLINLEDLNENACDAIYEIRVQDKYTCSVSSRL